MLNHDRVSHGGILLSHQQSCLELLAGYRGTVLMLHDTTVLNYSGLDIDQLGQIGAGHGRGWYAHNSLMVTPDNRQVIGLFNQILHRRATVNKRETRQQRSERVDCESRLWKDAVATMPQMPAGVRVVDVSDRGSDITQYMAYQIAAGRQFLVRSQHNRVLLDDEGERQVDKLHQHLRGLAPTDRYKLRMPEGEGLREATMGLAYQRVQLCPPRPPRGQHASEPIQVWALIARQIDPPAGADPLEWILLTNIPIHSSQEARQTISHYACRWMIEDYHKGMKSGCGIENLQMTTASGLSNAIALLSVLAVHVLRLRCKARDEVIASEPAQLHEEEVKVRLIAAGIPKANWQTLTVWEFYMAVARLGGYQLNPKKRPPGWLILWRGYVRLQDMALGAQAWQERCVQTLAP